MAESQYLLDLMRSEMAAAGRLLDLLHEEERVLAQRDTAALEALTTRKRACLAELEPCAAARLRLLNEAGLSPDRAGFEALLERIGTQQLTQIRLTWDKLRVVLVACQEQNLRNGQVLEAGRRFADDALSVLLGTRDDIKLYGRDGSTNQTRANHTYAKV